MEEIQLTKPLELLQLIVAKLEPYNTCFAIAGGLAASFYRNRPRLTNDVDIAFNTGTTSKDTAVSIIESIGLEASYGWIYDSKNHLENMIALVIGRQNKNDFECTIDILLPSFPWLPDAVERAQYNIIDFGFNKLPTITPEDIIIAKAFALTLEPNRFQDMDDIQAIFQNNNSLDQIYLAQNFEKYSISLPKQIETNIPSALRRISKANRH